MLKKYILFLLCGCFFGISIFAQDYRQEEKENRLRKVPQVTIVDIAGNLHSGWLWYANDSILVLTKNKLTDANLMSIHAEDIFLLEAQHKNSFGKKFLKSLGTGTAGISFFILEEYTRAEAVMIGPGTTILLVTILTGIPVSLLSAWINVPNVDIKYKIDGKTKLYEEVVPYLKKTKLVLYKKHFDSIIDVDRNEYKLRAMPDEDYDQPPLSSLGFHGQFAVAYSGNFLDRYFEKKNS